MKTRTLLLLSVGTALMILLAGGVLLFQLLGQDSTTQAIPLGTAVQVGDAEITVSGSSVEGSMLRVDVELGGVVDERGVESFSLVTGDQRLEPIVTPAEGRCAGITDETTTCTIDFDVSATAGSSRVLVMRRGDDQATWRLA